VNSVETAPLRRSLFSVVVAHQAPRTFGRHASRTGGDGGASGTGSRKSGLTRLAKLRLIWFRQKVKLKVLALFRIRAHTLSSPPCLVSRPRATGIKVSSIRNGYLSPIKELYLRAGRD
jgi:hypothetical protein